MSEMSHDGAAYLVMLFSLVALILIPFGIRLLRQKRPIGLIFITPLVQVPAKTLFTETFGEPPDSTITDLKAIRTGGAGNYRAFIQFHAPPETVKRLVPGTLSHPSYVRSRMGWGSEDIPVWFHIPSDKVEEGSLPKRTYTGHFGITFFPDGPPQIRYTSQENLIQVFWGYYD
jgi:hypothetical protein